MLRIWFKAFGIEVEYLDSGKFFIKTPDDFSEKITYLITFDVVGKLVPIIFTFFCYWSVHLILTSPYQNDKNTVAPRVLWYSGIQLICFLPGILADLSGLWGFKRPFQLNLLVYTLHHAWGFLNLVVYWFLRPSENKRKDSYASFASEMSVSGNDTSLTVVSYF